jgi:hypothetical protein
VAQITRQRAPARAPSSRNTGRHHLVTPGDIISERLGDFIGIRTLRETPRPVAQYVAVQRASDPPAAAEQTAAAGAALYQEFLKWQQLRGR